MRTYWQDTSPIIRGVDAIPRSSEIAVIGSGLAGSSVTYWLQKNTDFKDIILIDDGDVNASFFRNAGHILHGTGESYKAMCSIHGRENAKNIMRISEGFCNDISNTIKSNKIKCDYVQGNYHFVGIDEVEGADIKESVDMMKQDGFQHSSAMTKRFGEMNGFIGLDGERWCKLSASANPAKFRNGLINIVKKKGTEHYSQPVKNIHDMGEQIKIEYENGHSMHDFVVVCTNAYTNLVYSFVKDRGMIEPFKGQIIVSKPLQFNNSKIAFSSDHGYIYGTITADNRILVGGWRNHIPGGETGSYDLTVNPAVEIGLKQWVKDHLRIRENIQWEYSWAGVMGSSKSGLPLIGHTSSNRIWMCAGFTGYGFSWAHGSAKMLVDMMMGNEVPDGHKLFDPRR